MALTKVPTDLIDDSAVTTAKIADDAVTPDKLSQPITSGTAVSASGTAVNFYDLPSWITRITIQLSGISLSGSADALVQIGDASGVSTTGYAGCYWYGGSSINSGNLSAGFFAIRLAASGNVGHGTLVLTKVSGNTWMASGGSGLSNTGGNSFVNGSKTLDNALQRVRVTTTNGTDTFDAGTINIIYE